MTSEYVVYEGGGPIVTIRLNRAERMNSLSRELVSQLDVAWRRYMDDPVARVAIYTGTGKAFCAGMDVKEAAAVAETSAADEVHVPEPPLTIFHGDGVTKPVIAAVNGYAIGGGFFDVLRCDLRVAAEGAVFQLAEVARSVLPHPLINGIAGALPDCLVRELALGRRLSAQRAYEIGLVNRVVPDDELIAEATLMAEEIAELPPLAVAGALAGLARARALRPDEAELHRWQEAETRKLRASEDYREALDAFLEKRQPEYKGR